VLVTHPDEREWVGLSTSEIDLKRILVAHDFSADAELALKYAFSLAGEYQAELHLVHVLSKEGHVEPEIAWAEGGVESLYTDVTRRLQEAVPKEAFLWCNIVNVVRSGRPADEILAYAKEKEIDLVCIGASGAGFRLGALLGSTVDRVLRRAPCPVFVARPVRTVASTEPKTIARSAKG
jgi:nucleotide-binding universal stress UspA family protein